MVSDKFTIQTSCSLVLRHVFYSLCIKSERLKLNITKCGQFTFLLDQMYISNHGILTPSDTNTIEVQLMTLMVVLWPSGKSIKDLPLKTSF